LLNYPLDVVRENGAGQTHPHCADATTPSTAISTEELDCFFTINLNGKHLADIAAPPAVVTISHLPELAHVTECKLCCVFPIAFGDDCHIHTDTPGDPLERQDKNNFDVARAHEIVDGA